MAKVRIWTAPGCPYCEALKEDLKACGVPYEERSVADKKVADELIGQGINAVPVIEINGERVVGYGPEIRRRLCGK